MPRLANRKGFALPMAILVIAVITAALAAAFMATNAEIASNQAVKGTDRAYAIAENGLEQFIVRRSQSGWCQYCGSPPTTAAESTKVASNGGYAWVVSRRIHPSSGTSDPAYYFITSTGVDTTTKMSAGGQTIYATRAVGMYAKWNSNVVNVMASWTSLSGVQKNGTGTIDGNDQCGVDTALAGVTVPTGLYSQSGTHGPTGNPPIDSNQTVYQLAQQVKIDWAGILGGSITPDIEIPPGSFPSAATFTADTSYWPIIRIHTNGFSLPNAGRGMIIADSDFVISGSNMWNGIVLVGGSLTSNGNNTTAGATISGLNVLLGDSTVASGVNGYATANGQKTYVYNSCWVSRASKGLQGYVAYPNTWVDNVAIY